MLRALSPPRPDGIGIFPKLDSLVKVPPLFQSLISPNMWLANPRSGQTHVEIGPGSRSTLREETPHDVKSPQAGQWHWPTLVAGSSPRGRSASGCVYRATAGGRYVRPAGRMANPLLPRNQAPWRACKGPAPYCREWMG
jgi:hypothetical protein